MTDKKLGLRSMPANLGRVLVALGLVVLTNAAVLAWTSTGGAQGATVGSATLCASYDRWGEALYVQPFFAPVGAALDGTAIESQSVAVAINGLLTGNLTEANEKLAIDIVRDFLDEACDGVDRDAPGSTPIATPTTEPTPAPTTAPEPTATAEPEPTATAAPEPTATPGPTATPQPQAAASDDQNSADPDSADPDSEGVGLLATTGAGPMTALLAFVGGALVFAGSLLLAFEDRRRLPAY